MTSDNMCNGRKNESETVTAISINIR